MVLHCVQLMTVVSAEQAALQDVSTLATDCLLGSVHQCIIVDCLENQGMSPQKLVDKKCLQSFSVASLWYMSMSVTECRA